MSRALSSSFSSVFARRLLLPLQRGLSVRLFLCLLVTTVSAAKAAEPIRIPYGMWTRRNPGNHTLGGGPDPGGKGHFGQSFGHTQTCPWSMLSTVFAIGAAALLLPTTIRLLLLLLLLFFDPGTLFPGNGKNTLCNKKVQKQAGMNLTPPPS